MKYVIIIEMWMHQNSIHAWKLLNVVEELPTILYCNNIDFEGGIESCIDAPHADNYMLVWYKFLDTSISTYQNLQRHYHKQQIDGAQEFS